MKRPVIKIKIQTLGHLSLSVDGKPVAAEWPNQTLKLFFCSLLSPLDLSFTCERICRSIGEISATSFTGHRLEDTVIKPLSSFLIDEIGFNPLITENESIRFNRKGIYVDAFEFRSTVVQGLRLLSIGDHTVAFRKFTKARELYTGSYLQGFPGKIIEDTRNELDSLYRTAIMDALPLTQNYGFSNYNRKANPRSLLMET
ncbi:MAG: hypothetical protein HXX11_05675 [Desulfuromonadales bacterium]|nr:hypothetical protein [Desulfuromonadales bacterium]